MRDSSQGHSVIWTGGIWMGVVLAACGEQSLELVPPLDAEPVPSAARAEGPFDDRPVVRAEVAPPPIAGGTLLTTQDGKLAIAADRERDTVTAVDLDAETVAWTTRLEAASRPGRIVETDDGRLHVALRGASAVVTLDRAGAVVAQTSVCADPRGLAFSAQRALLLVACRDGSLLGLEPDGRDVTVLAELDPDARDVVVHAATDALEETIHVTRFRSAEVLRLDAALSVERREAPPPGVATALFMPATTSEVPEADVVDPEVRIDLDPGVAWRAAATEDGLVLLHQRGRRQSVPLSSVPIVSDSVAPSPEPGFPYGSVGEEEPCSDLAGPAVTFVARDGVRASSGLLPGRLLVDVAVSNEGWIAMAEAGSLDVEAPPSEPSIRSAGATLQRSGANVPVAWLFRTSSLDADEHPECETSGVAVTVPEYNQAVAVAFNPARPAQLVVQLRDPAQLLLVELHDGTQTALALSEQRTTDTGHVLFHQATPSGVACATCHPEGAEDGRVWVFDEAKRRTQSLEIGVRETAPLHWRGDLDDFSALMNDVFVGRMGGTRQSQERIEALESWLAQLERPTPLRDPSDALAQRGKALFESEAVGCASCHAGPALTNNESHDVGTGETLQVPSLIGVAYRTPLMHDGCAADLWGRFDPACGGETHGVTSQLTVEELGALIAYMESL